MPLLRGALVDQQDRVPDVPRNLILESNTLLQFWRPSLYLMVVDAAKPDFKPSARLHLDLASALVLRHPVSDSRSDSGFGRSWGDVPGSILQGKPHFVQELGQELPPALVRVVASVVGAPRFY
jgi:hypothetical protein